MIALRKSIIFALIVFCVCPAAYAANMGHYSPDDNGVRDYVMPHKKGLSVTVDNTYFTSNTFKGTDGGKLNSLSATRTETKYIKLFDKTIPVTRTESATVDIDFNNNTFYQTWDLTYKPDVKLLGADYAFSVSPTWGYAMFEAKLKADARCTVSIGDIRKTLTAAISDTIKEENTGFGDLYVQPLWFAWRGKHYDAGLSYGFYAPTGQHDKNGLANIGYGFWTQQVQANLYYFPFKSQGTALVLRPTYEWNSERIDEDVTPGQTISIEYGVSQIVFSQAELAVLGYEQIQLSGEKGDNVTGKHPISGTRGIGGQIKGWVVKDKCSIAAKYSAEYGTKMNFEGSSWSLNLSWIF